jgi:predicted methyltransferase
MDVDAIIADVASAVGLAEGPAGVCDVLRVIARHEPVAAREVGRLAELPVPIVAAICGELRSRGVVDQARPVRLTVAGRAALQSGQPGLSGECQPCAGTGVAVPDALAPLAARLAGAAAGMPAAKLELDQTHCTVDTKLRRVLRMHETGALGGQRVLLLGDDDLMSVALAAFAAGQPSARPARVTVVDCDRDLLAFLAAQLGPSGLTAELIEHDLREPLPAGLRGEFDVACTDPPYTVAGAELFLSRAVAALAPGAGRHVFFSFGARRPEETLRTQRLIAGLGLTVRALLPGFNSYAGAGILAGVSNLYHLRTTVASEPLITGQFAGPLYTAENRVAQTRPYRCAGCGAVHEVGAGAAWQQIAGLKAAGCPACGGTVFRPGARGSDRGSGDRSGGGRDDNPGRSRLAGAP